MSFKVNNILCSKMNNVIIDKVNGVKISTGGSPTPVLSELDEALNAAGSYIVCTYKAYDDDGNEQTQSPYTWHLATSSDVTELIDADAYSTDANSFLGKPCSHVELWGGYSRISFTADKTGTLSFDCLSSYSYSEVYVEINNSREQTLYDSRSTRNVTQAVTAGDTVMIEFRQKARYSGYKTVAIKNLQIIV